MKQTTPRIHPPTPRQIAEREFARSVKDRSTEELGRDLSRSEEEHKAVGQVISSFEAKLRSARAEHRRIDLERSVLRSIIEGRR